jgi:hypothetical protein
MSNTIFDVARRGKTLLVTPNTHFGVARRGKTLLVMSNTFGVVRRGKTLLITPNSRSSHLEMKDGDDYALSLSFRALYGIFNLSYI